MNIFQSLTRIDPIEKNYAVKKMIRDSDYIDNKMMFIVKSEIRLKILTELNARPQTVKEIVDNTNMVYSSVSNNINRLELNDHVQKIDRVYEITPMTRLHFNQLMEFKKSIDVIKNFDSFWSKHKIKYLNNELIENITELYESRLIETNPTDIYRTHNNVKKQLKESKNVKGILPYIHPDYPELIEDILREDGNVELIMERRIYKGIIKQIDEGIKRKSIKSGRLKIHVLNESIELYLLICDNSMNLGLFRNDGSYDQNRILNCESKESLHWANTLFEDIKERVI